MRRPAGQRDTEQLAVRRVEPRQQIDGRRADRPSSSASIPLPPIR